MKKIILLIVSLIVFTSCTAEPETPSILTDDLPMVTGFTYTVVKDQEETEDLELAKGNILVEEGSVQEGYLKIGDGLIAIDHNCTITGDITLDVGQIIIGNNVTVNGDINTKFGRLILGDNNTINGNIKAFRFNNGEDNVITGSYPE